MTIPRAVSLNDAVAHLTGLGLKPLIRKTFIAGSCLYDAVHGRDAHGRDTVILLACEGGYNIAPLDPAVALPHAA